MVTDKVCTQTRMEIARRGWRIPRLAQEADVTAPHVRALLCGERGRLNGSWRRIFEALDLELTLVPRQPQAHEAPRVPRVMSGNPYDS